MKFEINTDYEKMGVQVLKEYKPFIIAAAWTLGGIAILYGMFYSIALYKFGGM